MKEKIILSTIILVYLFISYALHILFLKIGNKYFFLVAISFYLFGTLAFFELLNNMKNKLREAGLYIEFGHANAALVEIAFICFAFGATNAIWLIYKYFKGRH